MLQVWLDTDIGGDVDDAAALLCAIRHPDIHLLGVSTVLNRVEINTWIAREMVCPDKPCSAYRWKSGLGKGPAAE